MSETLAPDGRNDEHLVLEDGVEVRLPDDPDLRALAEDIIDHAVLAFERVAVASVDSDLAREAVEPDGFEQAASAFLDALEPGQRKRVATLSAEVLRSRAGEHGGGMAAPAQLDLRSDKSLAAQLEATSPSERLLPQAAGPVVAVLEKQVKRSASVCSVRRSG